MIKKFKEIIRKRREKKKGFTLVELLAVIVILSIIMVITIPTVLGSMGNSKQKAFETVGQTMKKYLVDNYNNCMLGDKTISPYDENIFDEECNLKESISDSLINNSGYSKDDIEKVKVKDNGNGDFVIKIYPNEDGNFSGNNDYATGEMLYKEAILNGSEPDLSTGLVPVMYDNNNSVWVIVDPSEKWYEYSKQEWANAVSLDLSTDGKRAKLLNEDGSYKIGTVLTLPDGKSTESDVLAMYVWIPRFSYTIGCTSTNSCLGYKVDEASNLSQATPGAIDIMFVDKNTTENYTGDAPTYTYISESDRNPTNYYTHPAFTFGEDELSGIWVGKFETTGSATTPTILPNITSLTKQKVSNQFATAQIFSAEGNIYGIDSTIADSHMMKNSEWSAVAYLSQSIYGKYGNRAYVGANKEIYLNNSSSKITGRSVGVAITSKKFEGLEGLGTYKYDGTPTKSEWTECKLCGTGASTTGNIYGIYDMSGGAHEYVMGNYLTETDDEFISDIDIKYYDKFTTTTPNNIISETKDWYSNSLNNCNSFSPWVARGGVYTLSDPSLFFLLCHSGSSQESYSFRTVLATVR